MAKEKQIAIKEAEITNNCPECFNQELKLTFYQKHKYNPFFHRTTDQVIYEIKCKKCYSIIYPVNWTPDIERVFEYYNKLVTPDRASIRFTTLFFILLLLILGLGAAAVYFYMEGLI
ncbi:hypothetical protein FVB32_07020 [Flagellimonas hymeniacidonis]|uniref:Uncharacterized protein n=1 Tax=Flagellimonas hymeniacidonis TaxID=2603628 RepID=A0A5C8V8L1_9FLAO|nr:hypothetical protein [Flagellimonas hymeniacidonis]TXN38037.1 hypothetical protein FVB32_07020 [Flagellimonas hymeniacidonis]